jgi:hypothetical protein
VTIGNIEQIRFPFFKTGVREPAGLNETERIFFSEVAFLLKTFFFVYLGISLQLISEPLIILAAVVTAVAFVLRLPAVRLAVKKPVEQRDLSVMAIMIPKGLAAVVLASIPVQQGIAGGETIQNVVYGVVLFSIVATSFLVLLMEKTGLTGLYYRVLSPDRSGFRRKAVPLPKETGGSAGRITPAGNKLFGGGRYIEKKPPEKDDES